MNNLNEIASYIKNNDNFGIVVHKNPDGDCLGSAKALCLALKKIGKRAKVILPSAVSMRLSFMWDNFLEEGDFLPDTVICVDVASFIQMGDLYETVYKQTANSICIDHHGTNAGYADLNYIDSKSAAAGEIIYELINILGIEPDIDMAEALLVSIADDTGCFQYSNTSSKTHLTTAGLYDVIPNPEPIMRALYNTKSKSEIVALEHLLPSFEYYFDGKVCCALADIEKLKKAGAEAANIDAWSSLPRSIQGVELSMTLKVISDNETKISLRSNDYIDVAALAAVFGGGGHVRAAGVTIYTDACTAKKMLLEEIKKLV